MAVGYAAGQVTVFSGAQRERRWSLDEKLALIEASMAPGDTPGGVNVRAMLESCGDDLPCLRDRALLSTAYDTGLRASELVAIQVEHILEATDPEARLLSIPRSKVDQEGEGANAFLSPRSARDRGLAGGRRRRLRTAVSAGSGATV
jgi:hypothetical protein